MTKTLKEFSVYLESSLGVSWMGGWCGASAFFCLASSEWWIQTLGLINIALAVLNHYTAKRRHWQEMQIATILMTGRADAIPPSRG